MKKTIKKPVSQKSAAKKSSLKPKRKVESQEVLAQLGRDFASVVSRELETILSRVADQQGKIVDGYAAIADQLKSLASSTQELVEVVGALSKSVQILVDRDERTDDAEA